MRETEKDSGAYVELEIICPQVKIFKLFKKLWSNKYLGTNNNTENSTGQIEYFQSQIPVKKF